MKKILIFIFLFSVNNLIFAEDAAVKKAESYVADGNKYYDKNDYINAKMMYQKAISKSPGHSMAHFNMAVTYTQLGEVDSAIKEYKEVIRINPQDATAHNNLGNLYAKGGNKDLAILEYNQAIKINPGLYLAHNSLGDLYFMEGRYVEAEKEFLEVIKLVPEETAGYNNLGNVYYKLGRLDDAIAQYNRAIEIDPRLVCALTNKAQVYIKKDNPAFALSSLNQALKYTRENPTVYNLLGDVYRLKGGNETEAIECYKKVIVLKKDYAEAYYKLGIMYRYTDINESIRYLKEYQKYGKDPARMAKVDKYLKFLTRMRK